MFRSALSAASLLLFCEAAIAKDLGVQGPIFEISEPDLFAQIQAKFAAMEASGEVDRINRDLQDRAVAKAERPDRVEGIIRTETPRQFHFDPTITLDRDLVTAAGIVFAEAGQTVNPLDYVPMNQRIIFFDGDDPDQVAWARSELDDDRGQAVQPVLIGGPVLELTRDWGHQVFFDQNGELIGRFGITQVPARVSRDGQLMLVEEVEP